MRFILRGRRSVWCSWRVTLVAPRIVNDVSNVTRINHESVFFVAGAVFGEVGVSLFVAGTAFREILGDSRSAKCCSFPYKMRLQDATRKVSKKKRVDIRVEEQGIVDKRIEL